MSLLTQKAYAKHRKVSPQYVNTLVRKRRIPVNRNGLINVKRADAILNATRRLGRIAPRHRQRGQGLAPGSTRRPSDTTTLTGWRAQTEEFKARQAKLEYEHSLKTLLPAAEVLEAERRKNSNIRASLRRVARDLAPEVKAVAASASIAEIEALVLKQIDEALGELAADPLGACTAGGTIAAAEAPAAKPSLAGFELAMLAVEASDHRPSTVDGAGGA
jgi:hypothetical protein